MRLSKLEIKGFKSFGEKAVVHFNEGVTAIVGPNGCGKSNVIDAIRWVLGEQSTKALRSEKMENIIFNGTKDKKASQLAEVSLTFENTKNILPTAYTQITITRKLYRSGESEYRLNDVPCRLKDITDLFLDTGIGSDSYAIIELKMIDEIIVNKEHSRRALFEEAAGISKYKLRKKQTFSKLNDTEADLSRVEDLLFEIKKNLKVLENQAKKAEKYQWLKEQYKNLSVQLASVKIAGFRELLSRLSLQEENINRDVIAINTEIELNEAQIQHLKLDFLHQEKNLSVQQKATNDFINEIRNYENENKLKNQQLKFLQEKIKRLELEKEKDYQQLNHIQYNKNRLNAEFETEHEKLLILQKEINEQQNHIQTKKLELDKQKQNTNEIAHNAAHLNNLLHQTEKEIAVLNIQIDSFLNESAKNEKDTEIKNTELNTFTVKRQSIENDKKRLELDLQNELENEEKIQQAILQKNEDLAIANQSLMQHLRVKDAKENEHKLTKSLVDNLEGYPQSIKFLRKNSLFDKKAPLLSDVLFCKEEYRIAIENFLEPLMNYLVVDSYHDAILAVNMLKDASVGKAGFFILDNYLESISPKKIHVKGVLALDVLEVEDKYHRLCTHLLQNVYLVDDTLEQDLNDNLIEEGITLLGKSGRFIKSKTTLFGGSVGLFEGKRIGRAKNLELLTKEIKNIHYQCQHLQNQIAEDTQRLNELKTSSRKNAIHQLQQELKQIENLYVAVESKQEQYLAFLEKSNHQQKDIQAKLIELNAQLKEKNPKLEELKYQHNSVQQTLKIAELALSTSGDDLATFTHDFNQNNIKYHQQQNKVNNLEKDIEYRQSQEKRLLQQIQSNNKDLSTTKEEETTILSNPLLLDTQILEMYEQKEEMEKGLKSLEQAYYQTRGNITDDEKKQKVLRQNKENTQQIIADLKDKRVQLKLDLNSLKERLSLEFNIDMEDLLDAELQTIETETSLKNSIEKLKAQIDDYGPINPMAMEAYQEITERFNFIEEQKKDLLTAKKSLLQTIHEIDATAKEKFMQSFLQVRENFIHVFRSLFNAEDNCDLLLTDEENPLESDINIIARPKGKRPLTINQLSGGEKTLTAIALLFSLYLLKPAPFCIFDEVDAPLDDTNIDKFNQIIRKFSSDSQFIIVSHNKKTISYTDIVYGVTMPEQGVSKLVAVDLRDFE